MKADDLNFMKHIFSYFYENNKFLKNIGLFPGPDKNEINKKFKLNEFQCDICRCEISWYQYIYSSINGPRRRDKVHLLSARAMPEQIDNKWLFRSEGHLL